MMKEQHLRIREISSNSTSGGSKTLRVRMIKSRIEVGMINVRKRSTGCHVTGWMWALPSIPYLEEQHLVQMGSQPSC